MRLASGLMTRLGLTLSVGLLLPGCPFSDDYFIDSNYGAAQAGGAASSGGARNSGGAAGAGLASACSASNCADTCCNDKCVYLLNDPSNCGLCGTSCPGGQACALGQCTGGWTTIAPAPASFVAREKSTYVAMGDRLFIFGGVDTAGYPLNDGAIYDPTTNRWSLVAIDANTPSPRRLASAVWTGTWVLLYGGRADSTSVGYQDASAYDPSTNSWIAIPTNSNGHVGAIGVTSSAYSAFWGGWGLNSVSIPGTERFSLATSAWAPAISNGIDPGALDNAAWAFTGQYLYVFGGRINGLTKTNLGYSYDLVANSWSNLTASTSTTTPTARWGALGVWDGATFYVWAGRDENGVKNDGASLAAGTWKTMTTTNAPAVRSASARVSGWAFARASGDLLFIGGQDFLGNFLTDGGRYTVNTLTTLGTWTSIPSWASGESHQWGVAAYVGGALVVWGGRNGTVLTTTGERWAP
jgi:hypothetical protein